MPPSTRRRAQRHLPPPPAEFSDSEEDLEEEELHPGEQDGDDVGDDMAVMEDDLDDDALGKSCLVLHQGCFVSRYVTFTIRKLLDLVPHFGLSQAVQTLELASRTQFVLTITRLCTFICELC
jgi:hypothetical protein